MMSICFKSYHITEGCAVHTGAKLVSIKNGHIEKYGLMSIKLTIT